MSTRVVVAATSGCTVNRKMDAVVRWKGSRKWTGAAQAARWLCATWTRRDDFSKLEPSCSCYVTNWQHVAIDRNLFRAEVPFDRVHRFFLILISFSRQFWIISKWNSGSRILDRMDIGSWTLLVHWKREETWLCCWTIDRLHPKLESPTDDSSFTDAPSANQEK
jgi:hypothetical protein